MELVTSTDLGDSGVEGKLIKDVLCNAYQESERLRLNNDENLHFSGPARFDGSSITILPFNIFNVLLTVGLISGREFSFFSFHQSRTIQGKGKEQMLWK